VIWPRYASRGHLCSDFINVLQKGGSCQIGIFLYHNIFTLGRVCNKTGNKFKTIKGSKYGLLISTEKEISL